MKTTAILGVLWNISHGSYDHIHSLLCNRVEIVILHCISCIFHRHSKDFELKTELQFTWIFWVEKKNDLRSVKNGYPLCGQSTNTTFS